jgi:hypothetical protein
MAQIEVVPGAQKGADHCPYCGKAGQVVRRLPAIYRVCVQGHTWEDAKSRVVYIPMKVRLQEMTECLAGILSALEQAETMIKDCASFLTPEQRAKLSVHYELHQIGLAKTKITETIATSGEKT